MIEVADDGAGLDRARILAKAGERGLTTDDLMSDEQVWQLIFAPGFTTADVVTEVSGRGFGMDVVNRNIDALGGNIKIRSIRGMGTRISIHLPLTLAIVDGLLVSVGREKYLVPLASVVECLPPGAADIRISAGMPHLVRAQGDELSVLALHELFGLASKSTPIEAGSFVVVEADGVKKALFVDELLGRHRVLIKRLESPARNRPGVSGVSTLGDGSTAHILDIATIVRDSSNRCATIPQFVEKA